MGRGTEGRGKARDRAAFRLQELAIRSRRCLQDQKPRHGLDMASNPMPRKIRRASVIDR
jgi:hypothetical protein